MKNKRSFLKIISLVIVVLAVIGVFGWLGFKYYLSLPCPPNKPLRDAQTRFCYACDSDEKIQLDASLKFSFNEQCAVCPNREVDRYLGFYCILKCPLEKPVRDFYDVCHPCNQVTRIYVSYTYESACEVCESREFNHGFCFKKCPHEKPFRDSQGNCYGKDKLL